MSCPSHGPCSPFITQADLCCLGPTGSFPDPCLTDGEAVPQAIIDGAMQAASELMWAETGRRFGTCEVTIRPCKKNCGPCADFDFFSFSDFYYGFTPPFLPFLDGGVWVNLPACSCPDDCWCSRAQELPLPYPVCDVTEVEIDGEILAATGYRVDEFRTLVRTDGGAWPRCQSSADLGEPGTFGVTLTYGRPVPQLVKLATAELACQFIKTCVNKPCDLPGGLVNLSRQGVSIAFIDPGEFWKHKKIGIAIVDLAIQTFNPHRLTRRPAVYSPDVGSRWRRTDT